MRNEELMNKWKPILEHSALPGIQDSHKAAVTATLLENTETAIKEGQSYGSMSLLSEAAPSNATADMGKYDPVLISLVRRSMPNLVAYDIAGVQPMTGPTGLIFAMHSKYDATKGDTTAGAEAFISGADPKYSGASTGKGLDVGDAEALGGAEHVDTSDTGAVDPVVETNPIAEMSFAIDKVTVEAKSRALKAEYSSELAQDLKAIHGLDAETELANMLSAELLAEINREVIGLVGTAAKTGAQAGTATPGTFNLDVDANGRWSVEKFKGLMFFIEREANKIAQDTRRGKGNLILCSSDVASALQMAGVLDYAPALSSDLTVDDAGNTFAGVLNGRYKVYIDPYAASQYLVVGYKGSSAFDAGIFYCPYVPLQMVRAVGENSFQSKIGFKTRYGIAANPLADRSIGGGATQGTTANSNVYYRKTTISNLL